MKLVDRKRTKDQMQMLEIGGNVDQLAKLTVFVIVDMY